MKKLLSPILVIAILFAAAYAGFFVRNSMNDPTEQARATSPTDMLLIGLQRPDFEMPDLEGNMHHVSEWDGKTIVLNFWATWCPPCREELPAFTELQEKYADQGLQFVGLAVDTPENVEKFMQEIPLNYPNLVDEIGAMQIGKLYGNNIGALPYTVIINKSGKIAYSTKGGLEKAEAEEILTAILN